MLNVAVLMGRLTADPELKHTQSGVSVTSFTIACDRSYCKQGEERQTDFINIVAWRTTAEFICKYFSKGQLAAVQGSIQTRSYTDKDGNKRKAFEIVAENAHFAEPKRDNKSASGGSYQSASGKAPDINADDEKPAPAAGSKSDDFKEVPVDDDLPF